MPTPFVRRPIVRRALGITATFAVLALAAGCGGAADASAPPSTAARPASTADVPSAQTRMICAHEAQEDLEKTLATETVAAPIASWRGHVYSCDYRYASGSFTLSVRQAADPAHARTESAALSAQLTRRMTLQGLGENAFTTANGSVVVQKDNDVLLVDISHLPARFGVPSDTRANAAISIAATIMGCWTGA